VLYVAVKLCVVKQVVKGAVCGQGVTCEWADERGRRIVGREVKCDDPGWTRRGGGSALGVRRRRGTEVGGSKSIRYRCSSDSKLCRRVCVWARAGRN
jgi:hypothetical protein